MSWKSSSVKGSEKEMGEKDTIGRVGGKGEKEHKCEKGPKGTRGDRSDRGTKNEKGEGIGERVGDSMVLIEGDESMSVETAVPATLDSLDEDTAEEQVITAVRPSFE